MPKKESKEQITPQKFIRAMHRNRFFALSDKEPESNPSTSPPIPEGIENKKRGNLHVKRRIERPKSIRHFDLIDIRFKLAFQEGRTAFFFNRTAKYVPNFYRATHKLKFNGHDYHLISRNESFFYDEEKKFVSIDGSGPKSPIVLLDPQSKSLDDFYQALISKQQITRNLRTKTILLRASKFVRHTLSNSYTMDDVLSSITYDTDINTSEKTAARIYGTPSHRTHLIGAHRRDHIYTVRLESFLENSVGKCRIHALALSYFISRLIHDKYLPMGQVFNHRANVRAGNQKYLETGSHRFERGSPHVWVIYKNVDGDLFNIDAMWGKLNPLYKSGMPCAAQMEKIDKHYGYGILDTIVERYGKFNTSNESVDASLRL